VRDSISLPQVSSKGPRRREKNARKPFRLKLIPNGFRYFKSRINERHSVILAANPVGLLVEQLPASVEWYTQERLGYELTCHLIRDPFLSGLEKVPNGQLIQRGMGISFKQKFYQYDGNIGMFYFGHELRFTHLSHLVNTYDDALQANRTLKLIERRYEYSLLVGNRLIERSGGPGLTLDVFGGIGLGYRTTDSMFENTQSNNLLFDSVNRQSLTIPVRLGFMLGYAF
jgi:hypothetical protein